MRDFEDKNEYTVFCREVVLNNHERDGSDLDVVANQVVGSLEAVNGVGVVMKTVANPWADQPIAPYTVFKHTGQEYPYQVPFGDDDTFRDVAVELFCRDLDDAREYIREHHPEKLDDE